MVWGYSVVLYSRLHLLVNSRLILRFVLIMIIVDGICLHTPAFILQFVSLALPAKAQPTNKPPGKPPPNVLEPFQASWFTLQQLIIQGLYVKAAIDHSKDRSASDQRTRKVLLRLITVQVLGTAIDILVITLECSGYLLAKTIIHSFIYSIKLELEFVILSQLIGMTRLGAPGQMSLPAIPELPDSPTPESSPKTASTDLEMLREIS
jgi:hypothetical protein